MDMRRDSRVLTKRMVRYAGEREQIGFDVPAHLPDDGRARADRDRPDRVLARCRRSRREALQRVAARLGRDGVEHQVVEGAAL